MKPIISKTISLIVMSATFFSFSPKPGGEGFEISLNNKVVMQRFGSDMNNVNSLQLNSATINDQLSVKYYHCGRVGKNRALIIKDGQNDVLKVFRYADVASPVTAMTIPVKEIRGLEKGNDNTLKLYYTSGELPNGRLLVSIRIENI